MVDYIANSAEDLLIDSFQLKLPPKASYVTDRRSVSFFTVVSNIYQSGSGIHVTRLRWVARPVHNSVTLHFDYS